MTVEHVEHYRRHGFAVVRGVFAPGEMRELSAAFDRIYAQGMAYGRSYRDKNVLFRLSDDRALGPIVRMVQWPSYFDAVLNRFRLDPRMLAILAPLIGRDLKQIINQLHWKPPRAAMVEFGYHQDARFRQPREAYRELARSYVQTGIAVDPHSRANGAMTMCPGSHALGELPVIESGEVMHQAQSAQSLIAMGLDPSRVVDLDLELGDVALWNPYTVHGSGPNTSSMDRRLYINGYVIAENCDRGEWAFRAGAPCQLGEPVLVHYEDLYTRPEPHYVDD